VSVPMPSTPDEEAGERAANQDIGPASRTGAWSGRGLRAPLPARPRPLVRAVPTFISRMRRRSTSSALPVLAAGAM